MVSLSPDQRRLVEDVRSLTESAFADRDFTWDGDLPWANVAALAEHDLLGINLPERYGGLGMTEYESILAIETIGRICPDTAKFLITQQMIAPRAIPAAGRRWRGVRRHRDQ